ncbi:frizzled-7-A-like, partial [Paramuricea clavata]
MKFIQHSTMRRVFVFLIVLFNLFYRTESQNSSALTTPSLVPRIPFPPTTRFESANLSSTDIITHLQVSTDALSGPAITRVPTTSTDALPTGPAITRVPTTSTDHALPTGPAITRVRPTTSTDALPRTAIVRFPTPSAASRSTPSSTSLPKNNNTKGSIRTEVPANSPCWTFYNESYLPQGNMEIAHFQMHQLYPLVYTYCSASLLPLMCSVYVPKFDPATETNLQPCADLCDQVANDCHYAASKLNFRITTLLNRCRVDNAQCFRPNISSPRNPLS